ncbi:MAG: hypothetical protein KJ905_03215, partial [Nanoarchaeota archaeon]|nr:hypothetical protein [Nanoarchaeota archaeon]
VPTVSVSKSTSATSSVTVAYSCTDAGSGVSTCALSSSSGTFSGSKVSGLTCGTSYDITITSTDGVANSGSSTVAMTTSSCSNNNAGSSGGSSSSSAAVWTTRTVDDTTFEQGYTSQLGVKNRIQVSVGGTTHHVGIVSVEASKVTIEIASDPVTVSLAPGEDTKVDVDSDNFYDIYVLLNSIVNGKADLTIQKINEAVPEGADSVVTTGEDLTGTTGTDSSGDETDGEGSSLTWLWVLIGLVVVAAIGLSLRKKR